MVTLPSFILTVRIALSLICKVSTESAIILSKEIVFADILSPIIIPLGIWLVVKKPAANFVLVILPSAYFEFVTLPSKIVLVVIAPVSIFIFVTALVSNFAVDILLLTILSILTEPADNFAPVMLPSDICAVVIAFKLMGCVTVNKSTVVLV